MSFQSLKLQPDASSLGLPYRWARQNTIPFNPSNNDSLPDVHWRKALLCYCSRWSHGCSAMALGA
ncbi:hypothetical protein K503DRAFT_772833 [Rhizopogon vinicolor AM-OR11-026]|uniref:Uncharacterized protein n=1 Tax=Rhizopogon vinicolor AM-OR11-026 TaxID=1314800 RepID=A0A1B7MU29_9AGAM|nr:hypothetical protein K503DRAFT_772833 [Rhizopogon vinicolor AM-OR11-026]